MTGNAADLVARHRPTLDAALAAIRTREFFTHFPEQIKAYPQERAAAGKAWFDGLLGGAFPLDQAGTDGQVGGERSPYGFELGITYPHADIDALLPAMAAGLSAKPPPPLVRLRHSKMIFCSTTPKPSVAIAR